MCLPGCTPEKQKAASGAIMDFPGGWWTHAHLERFHANSG
jgi:hypothetical protein